MPAAMHRPTQIVRYRFERRHDGLLSLDSARRPWASMTTSPSSLLNAVSGRSGRRSRTSSDGRHSFTPRGLTHDRPVDQDWVCAIMASRIWSSDKPGSSSPSLWKGVPFSRSTERTGTPIREIICASRARLGRALSGTRRHAARVRAWRINASVLRDVPQSGLWVDDDVPSGDLGPGSCRPIHPVRSHAASCRAPADRGSSSAAP